MAHTAIECAQRNLLFAAATLGVTDTNDGFRLRQRRAAAAFAIRQGFFGSWTFHTPFPPLPRFIEYRALPAASRKGSS